jgi:hypothetical protein
MKYVMSWRRKRHGTTAAYEAAQARVLALMQDWRKPDEVVIHQFLIRSEPGQDGGGYAVFETDDLDAVHDAVEVFSAFNFHIDPVVDIDVAPAARGVAIEWRDAAV